MIKEKSGHVSHVQLTWQFELHSRLHWSFSQQKSESENTDHISVHYWSQRYHGYIRRKSHPLRTACWRQMHMWTSA